MGFFFQRRFGWLGRFESLFALFSGTLFAIGAWLLASDTGAVFGGERSRARWVVRLSAIAVLIVLSAQTIPMVQGVIGEEILTIGYRSALAFALGGLYSILGDPRLIRIHGERRVSKMRGLLKWTIGFLVMYAVHAAIGVLGLHRNHPLTLVWWDLFDVVHAVPAAILTFLGSSSLNSLRSDWVEVVPNAAVGNTA